MEPWRRRIGPRNLLALGGLGAVVRWTALAFSPPLWVLFPLQALHALSYAATFIASLLLVEQLSTPRNASAAQAINSALSGGVLSGIATLLSGWLFDHAGVHGYLLMSAMCAVGMVGVCASMRAPAGSGLKEATMRLFGCVCGQFHSTAGGMGMKGGDRRIAAPVPFYVLEHPDGVALFDCGLHTDLADPADRYRQALQSQGEDVTFGPERR